MKDDWDEGFDAGYGLAVFITTVFIGVSVSALAAISTAPLDVTGPLGWYFGAFASLGVGWLLSR